MYRNAWFEKSGPVTRRLVSRMKSNKIRVSRFRIPPLKDSNPKLPQKLRAGAIGCEQSNVKCQSVRAKSGCVASPSDPESENLVTRACFHCAAVRAESYSRELLLMNFLMWYLLLGTKKTIPAKILPKMMMPISSRFNNVIANDSVR